MAGVSITPGAHSLAELINIARDDLASVTSPSRQIYGSMNIGSQKVGPKQRSSEQDNSARSPDAYESLFNHSN
ncbi:hypothetical protein E2C01_075354 [Portunus trituberculatus]|uniref:Uncharacterized protein n=1 Tax=Portunus trituberculatus TaxID=210409 RepID=A0A5B7IER9_PORTR|nr:hypothetical protein [Portunus trituberculatus]